MRKLVINIATAAKVDPTKKACEEICDLILDLNGSTNGDMWENMERTYGEEVCEYLSEDNEAKLKKLRLNPRVKDFLANIDEALAYVRKKCGSLMAIQKKTLALLPEKADSNDLKAMQAEMAVLKKLEKDPKTAKAIQKAGEYLGPRIRGLQARIDAVVNKQGAKISKDDPTYYIYSASVDTGGDGPRKMFWVTSKPLKGDAARNAARKRIEDSFDKQGMNASNINFHLQKIGPKGAVMGLKPEMYTKIESMGLLLTYGFWDNKHLHWDHLKTPTDAERKKLN